MPEKVEHRCHCECGRDIGGELNAFEVLVHGYKFSLMELWHRVLTGQFDARSFIGDMALEMRTSIYHSNDKKFWEDYDAWKIKTGKE